VSFKVQIRGTQKNYRWSGDTQFAPCRDDHSLLTHMHGVFNRGLAHTQPWRLRHVSVMLHDIATQAERGRDLFEDETQRNWELLSDVMDISVL